MQIVVFLSIIALGNSLVIPTTIKSTLPKLVLSPLPIVYVYDHCPFCVRVRLAFGLKNVKHEIHFLNNDDVARPTALIGKRIAPIL
jgi:hypothetical protein